MLRICFLNPPPNLQEFNSSLVCGSSWARCCRKPRRTLAGRSLDLCSPGGRCCGYVSGCTMFAVVQRTRLQRCPEGAWSLHRTTRVGTHFLAIYHSIFNTRECGSRVNSKVKKGIAVRRQACHHRYGNSRAIWDHTVLPATRQRWHSRLYPSQLRIHTNYVLGAPWTNIQVPPMPCRLSPFCFLPPLTLILLHIPMFLFPSLPTPIRPSLSSPSPPF